MDPALCSKYITPATGCMDWATFSRVKYVQGTGLSVAPACSNTLELIPSQVLFAALLDHSLHQG